MSRRESKIPQVAVILETSHNASRARFFGILDYVRRHGPWYLNYVLGGTQEQSVQSEHLDHYDGIIARIPNNSIARMLSNLNTPIVLIDPEKQLEEYPELASLPSVTLDNAAVGELAARYFLENGHTRFAFVLPDPSRMWANERKEAFVKIVRNAGYECHAFKTKSSPSFSVKQDIPLCHWLDSLEKPVAVFAASDLEARQVIDTCLLQGIAVPYECAVLGVGNDPLICESCFPSLSSIDIHWEDGGFLAASLLDKKLKQADSETEQVRYAPKKIVERISTEQGPITDKLIVRVLEKIRLCSGFNIRVGELSRELQVTRQWLEKRFKQATGHSVMAEIKKRRFEKITSLIAETDLSFNEIAELCGFESGTYLRTLFKNEFGMTMSQYRDQN